MDFLVAGKQYGNQNSIDYQAMIDNLGISDCTRLINERIDDKELPKLFGWADICVFPYREIYGSGSLLMAYAYGKPVIASNIPAFVEETDNGSTGLLFQTENPKDLAKCIEEAVEMSSTEIENYKLSIKKLVDKKYNWNISAKKLFDIYASMYR